MREPSNSRRIAGSIRIDAMARRNRNESVDQHGPNFIHQTVTILDVVRWGCRIDGARDLNMGDFVSVSIPFVGSVPAVVMGYDGETYECTFDSLLRPSEVEAVYAEPEVEDVTAIRRRVRDTMRRSQEEAPPPKRGMLDRILRRKTG